MQTKASSCVITLLHCYMLVSFVMYLEKFAVLAMMGNTKGKSLKAQVIES